MFLMEDSLRVAHDRRQAEQAPTLESLYLAPLRSLLVRCGRLTGDGRPFLLNVEIKERSLATFPALSKLLARYAELFGSGAVTAVLVGWHPSLDRWMSSDSLLGVQHRIARRDTAMPQPLEARVALLSLDYGKTIGRWWRTRRGRAEYMAAVRTLARDYPALPLRVYNVPLNAAVYTELLDAGVDLIGTKSLEESRRLMPNP